MIRYTYIFSSLSLIDDMRLSSIPEYGFSCSSEVEVDISAL